MKNEQTRVALLSLLGNQRQASGEQRKLPLSGRVWANAHGLEAENGIREYYEDADCALMHYAREHYAFWRTRYPILASRFACPGIFGENFSTLGITEQTVCIGDIFQLGSAQIQVSWGRVACQTMAARLEDPEAPEVMHQQSRNGWFYRVLQPGEIACGDLFTLTERPYADWPLSKVQNIIFGTNATPNELAALSQLTLLAAPWRTLAHKRLTASVS